MSHSPGTGASLICHSCLLQLCCSYLSQPFWGMLNIRHIFLDRPNQEFPWACQLFPSFLQDTPPQPSPVPAPSPEAVTVQPVAHAQSPPAPLLSQAESSRACWSLGLMAGKDSDWRIVPTTGLLLGSQHWTASVSLLPTMPLVSTGSPAPPNPTQPPAVAVHLFWHVLPAHWLSWGQQPALLYHWCPILTPKVPPVQEEATFKVKTWSSSPPAQPLPGPSLPLLSIAGTTQGQDCPTPATKATAREFKDHLVCSYPSTLVPREQPHPQGPRAPHPPSLNW